MERGEGTEESAEAIPRGDTAMPNGNKLELYLPITVIGLSPMGDVRFCRCIDDNSPIVMKTIHKYLVQSEDEARRICDRLNWLLTINHPFILNTRDVFQDEKNVYVMSDFCSGGSLHSMIQTFSHLTESQAKYIAIQLSVALDYLHSVSCLYTSLIAENVLMDKEGVIHLTGFTNALVNVPFPYYKMIGYIEHMSPEMLLNKGINYSYDWYMLGCLVYEMIEGKLPFHGDTAKMTLQMILLGKIEYIYASPEAQGFINALLEPQPSKRLGSNLNDIKNHPWLADMPWDNISNRSTPSPLIRMNKTADPTSFCPHYKEDILEEGDNPQLYNEVFFNELH